MRFLACRLPLAARCSLLAACCLLCFVCVDIARLCSSRCISAFHCHTVRLPYLAACVKEALRFMPSVPLIARKFDKPGVVGGYAVPEGTEVVVPIMAVHHNEAYWPNSWLYDPSRFLAADGTAGDDGSGTKDPFAYVPFSAGTRNCIGRRFAHFEEMVGAHMFCTPWRHAHTLYVCMCAVCCACCVSRDVFTTLTPSTADLLILRRTTFSFSFIDRRFSRVYSSATA